MSALRKAVKNARIIESVKLTKRIRKAREGDGDVSRLELELRRVKELPVDAFALWVQKRHADKQTAGAAPIEQDDAGKNVVARLLKAKAIADALEAKPEAEEKAMPEETKESKTQSGPQASTANGKRKHKENVKAGKIAPPTDHEASDDEESDDEESDTSSVDKMERLKADRSTFLPTLNTGFMPGSFSDEEGASPTEHKGPAQKKPRKNRRGQRARRKILEQKYGRKANHLVQERKDKWEAFEKRRLKREAKAEDAITGANAIEVVGNRKERRDAALRPIHNSWAIAKAAKDAQKAAVPQGQKITF